MLATDPSADRTLLLGVLALQLDFIDRGAFVAAVTDWVADKSRPFGGLLVARGLSTARLALLESLVAEHLARHGGDPHKSLAAVSGIGSVKEDLDRLGDPQLSLAATFVGSDPLFTQPAPPPPADGSRFRVLRPHAKGGLGEVSVALDAELSREVALKEIQPRFAGDATSRARFLREAEITGRLEHPGIVPVYGLGHYPDGRPYYAMRFVAGDSLEEAVRSYHARKASLSVTQRASELRGLLGRLVDVCEAVAYAHSRGVLHRDLKPGNVMLGRFGETLLVDWGLAKAAGTTETEAIHATASDDAPLVPSGSMSGSAPTQAGSVLGTPAYASPEQAAGRLDQLGPASDVYGLGATLFALLTGRPPAEGSSIQEVLRKVTKGEIPSPRQIDPAVPKPLDAVCRKALSLRPQDRYGSAKELAAEVERFLADEPVAALPDTLPGRAARWLRHHRAVARAALAGLTATAAVALAAAWVVSGARDAEAAAKLRAEQAADENQRRLIRSLVDRGVDGWDDDPAAALPWLAEALRREKPDPVAERPHRVRLAAAIRALPQPVLFRVRPGASVTFADATPDGRTLLVRDGDAAALLELAAPGSSGEASVPSDGESSLRPIGLEPDARVIDACFDPEGERLATLHGADAPIVVGEDGSAAFPPPVRVRIWSRSDARLLASADLLIDRSRFPVRGMVRFSPDGRRVAAAVGSVVSASGVIAVWDAADGATLSPAAELPVNGMKIAEMRFVADGPSILIRSHGETPTAFAWEPGGEAPRALVEEGQALAFDPAGERLLRSDKVAEGDAADTQRIQIVDVRGGREPVLLRGARSANAGVFTPDGRFVVVASGRVIRFYDAATGEPLDASVQASDGPTDFVARLACDSGGRQLVAATHDRFVRTWSIPDGRPLTPPVRYAGDVLGVRFAADGRRLVARCSDGGDVVVQVWDAPRRGRPLPGLRVAERSPVVFSRDGRFLAVNDERGAVIVSDPGGPRPNSRRLATGEPATAFVFDPTSARLAIVTGPSARLWDAETARPISASFDHGVPIEAVAIAKEGRRLATAGGERVRVWDVASGKATDLAASERVADAVAISPDGRFVAASDEALRLFDAETGKPIRELKTSDEGSFFLVAAVFSPDGSRLAARSMSDHVEVWDVATGKPCCPPLAHAYFVQGMAWHPSGRRFATASWDHTARLWDPSTGKTASPPLEHLGLAETAVFSADGVSLVTACVSGEGEARLWESATGVPLAPAFPGTGARVGLGAGGEAVIAVAEEVRTFDVSPDPRPRERLTRFAETLAGTRIEDEQGSRRLTAAEIADSWRSLRGAAAPDAVAMPTPR